MTTSVKQQEKQESLLENENKLLQNTDEYLMDSYSQQHVKVGNSLRKMVKSAVIRFIGIPMYISRVISKYCS